MDTEGQLTIDKRLQILIDRQEGIERRLKSIQENAKYNTKLLEQIIDLIPARAPNKNMENLLKVQMGALRPLFDKVQFEGKDQLLSMLDNLFGGRV